MLDPLLEHALRNLLRHSVLQETSHMPARSTVNQDQKNPLFPRRVPQILQVSHCRLVESVRSGSRCRGSWCLAVLAEPHTNVIQSGLARVPTSQHLQEHIPAGMTHASASSADSLADSPSGRRLDLPTLHFKCLLITPVEMLVTAPFINVGEHHHFLIKLLTLVSWVGWSLRRRELLRLIRRETLVRLLYSQHHEVEVGRISPSIPSVALHVGQSHFLFFLVLRDSGLVATLH